MINRARRSFGVSVLILMLGFMAVAGALVYRLNQGSDSPEVSNGQYAVQSIELPQGAEVISAVAQDGVVTVTYRAGGKTGIRLINGTDGQVISDINITN